MHKPVFALLATLALGACGSLEIESKSSCRYRCGTAKAVSAAVDAGLFGVATTLWGQPDNVDYSKSGSQTVRHREVENPFYGKHTWDDLEVRERERLEAQWYYKVPCGEGC